MNDGPFKAHLDAAHAKMEREQDEEVTVKLKGKHLCKIRSLLFPAICNRDKDEVLLREIDQIVFDALQKI